VPAQRKEVSRREAYGVLKQIRDEMESADERQRDITSGPFHWREYFSQLESDADACRLSPSTFV